MHTRGRPDPPADRTSPGSSTEAGGGGCPAPQRLGRGGEPTERTSVDIGNQFGVALVFVDGGRTGEDEV